MDDHLRGVSANSPPKRQQRSRLRWACECNETLVRPRCYRRTQAGTESLLIEPGVKGAQCHMPTGVASAERLLQEGTQQ